jgi:phenylpropionate dioxygenase-like ring-hydroxylating dioxygenase large terminal subunit
MRTQYLNTPALLAELRAMVDMGPEVSPTMPPGMYYSEEILDLEREHIFGKDWICAGRADALSKPGDYLSFDLAGEPILLVRDSEGTIRALSNVCRHRSALLKTGCGHGMSIQCPYHAWTYDLKGQLLNAPFMDKTPGFNKRECRLPEFRVEVWAGFVYVNLDPEAEPLAPRLASLSEMVQRYRIGEMRTVLQLEEVWNANWKIVVDNGIESYHAAFVHSNSIGYADPKELIKIHNGELGYNAHCTSMNNGLGEHDIMNMITANPNLSREDCGKVFTIDIYPAQLIGINGDSIHWFTMQPLGVGQTKIHYGVGQLGDVPPPETTEGREYRAAVRANIDMVNSEDRGIVEQAHRGMQARAAGRGHYSHLEHTLWDFARYLASRLCAAQGVGLP